MPRVRRCRYTGCHAMVEYPHHYCLAHRQYEAAYLANRQKWARSHEHHYEHKYNTQTRYRNNVKSEQYKYYHTTAWSQIRQQALDRDHYICQYCGQPNSKTVDHIVPIEYDPSRKDQLGNLATICRQCHRLKTKWEQRWYGTGQGHHRKQQVAVVTNPMVISKLMHGGATDQ